MSTASITALTRMQLQDTGTFFVCNVAVNGTAQLFDLPVESISSTAYPLTITLNGTQISGQATPSYTVDYKHGVLLFNTPPIVGQLVVAGWRYAYFDDDEVAQAVSDAFNLHTNDYEPQDYINPAPGQMGVNSNSDYCISILAAIECLWFRATDASQEIDIRTPEGVEIPRSERFRQITEQIQSLTDQYKSYAGALGEGLFRIYVTFQRRVSYTTNRFVPLFREQEYNQPYDGFSPTSGPPGAIINIYGKYFTYTTAVTFGGVAATSFTVSSDWLIQAVVPVGAVTGQIGIMTSPPGGGGGVVLSTAQFVVGEPAPFIKYGPELVKPNIPTGY
jgi:IPT/TIG domain